MTTAKICVVGSFAVGMTIRAPHFPTAGETLRGSDFNMGPGGKGSNQAVGSARLGAISHLVARIGRDPLAEIALQLYREEGVNTDFLVLDEQVPTGVGIITLDSRGQNHIILDLGANNHLSPADVDAAAEAIQQSDVVMSVLEIPQKTALWAMKAGRKAGKTTILNPAPAEWLAPEGYADIDILTPNEGELKILCGLKPDAEADPEVLAHTLQQQGARDIVVTLGERGALIVGADGKTWQVPGIPIEPVDTTGAGDAFNCALAVSVAEGKSLEAAVKFAVAAGAAACLKLGVIPALPDRNRIDELLQ